MPLNNYANACRPLIEELRQSLSEDEIDLLAAYLLEDKGKSFLEWRKENMSQISAYVRATPAARLKQKRWQDPLQKSLLTYGAILHIEGAVILLAELGNTPVEPGGPYREMAAIAGLAYRNIFVHETPGKWPF